MKRIALNLIIIVTVLYGLSFKTDAQINEKFIGNWIFECSLAPAGFNEGIIEIRMDSVFTRYPGSDYRYSTSWIRMANDTLIFNVDVNGEIVLCRLVAVTGNKLAGTAGNMEDESLLILTKKEELPYYSVSNIGGRP